MPIKSFIRILGVSSCAALISCGGVDTEDDEDVQKAGYSLDAAPSGQNRYLAGPGNLPPGETTSTTTTTETTTTEPVQPPVESTTTTTTTSPVVSSTPPSTAPASTAPSYGSPVPGRRGFVYPPGVESKPENMVDVRDFTPGQKVRDPRTGKIFLVP